MKIVHLVQDVQAPQELKHNDLQFRLGNKFGLGSQKLTEVTMLCIVHYQVYMRFL
jgi:hypothetical protein